MLVHELSHLGGAQQQNAGQHLHLEHPHRLHEGAELLGMVNGLGLEELRPGLHFRLELRQHGTERVRLGRHGRADHIVRRAIQLVAGQVAAVVQPLDQLHNLH